jgi:hypothetical protein
MDGERNRDETKHDTKTAVTQRRYHRRTLIPNAIY